jgi:hypothetical protein
MAAMDPARARAIATRLHAGQREPDGMPVLEHIRRVVAAAPSEAEAVAWLHEALETGAISERDLLEEGLEDDELRALRLLSRPSDSRSDRMYLAHVELIARAAGPSGRMARMVKLADLWDRRLRPLTRADGWTPPYEGALRRLVEPADDSRAAVGTG